MRNSLFFVVIIFSFITSSAGAQNYIPFDDNEPFLSKWKSSLFNSYIKDSLSIEGQYKKEILKEYRERYSDLKNMFEKKFIVSAPEASEYLELIAQKLIDNNLLLKGLHPRVVFSRAWWPNASSYGEGTILFNLGMFTQLENESQLAFILGHELAHLYLDHSNKAIMQFVNTIHSKELKSEIKKIEKSEYEQNKKATALLTGLVFNTRRHSREHEKEADSLSFVFLSNTSFDARQSITALNILDSIDDRKFDIASFLKNQFNFVEYPFRDSWVKKQSSFFGGPVSNLTDQQKDSLKTHPDCALRIKILEPRVHSLSHFGNPFLISETKFTTLKERSRYDVVDKLLKDEHLSLCLFYSLQLFDKNQNDPWLAGTIGECLNRLYLHQKEHTLGKVVDLPNPSGDEDYNTLLQFIQEARLQDFASISHYFLNKYKEVYKNERLQKAVTNNDLIFK